MNVNDRVEVLLHSRAKGVATHQGWIDDWVPGRIARINRKTAVVELDNYYCQWIRTLPFDRIRKAGSND